MRQKLTNAAKFICIPKEHRPLSVRQRIADFCDHTEVHGFAFAARSLSWLEWSIYATLTILFIGLTVKDIANTTKLFLSEPTATILKLKQNRKLEFGHVTVCVPILHNVYPFSWNRTTVMNHSFYVTTPTAFRREDRFNCSTDIFDNDAVAALLKRLSEEGTSDLLERMSPKNLSVHHEDYESDLRDLFYLTLYMIGQITAVEQMNMATIVASWDDYDHEFAPMSIPLGWDFEGVVTGAPLTALRQTFEFYLKANVDLQDLLQIMAAHICSMISLTKIVVTAGANLEWDQSSCNNGLVPRLSWFSVLPWKMTLERQRSAPLFVCYDIGNVTIAAHQEVELGLVPTGIYSPNYNITNEEKESLSVFIDLSGSNPYVDPNNSGGNALEAQLFNKTSVRIAVLGEFRAESTSSAKCSEDLTFKECRLTCRANYALRNCNCWPLSLALLKTKPKTAPLCPFVSKLENGSFVVPNEIIGGDHSLNLTEDLCLRMARLNDPDTGCVSACPEKCSSLLLISTDVERQSTTDDWTSIHLAGERYIYPIFTEELLMDYTTYFSSLGGILGLWLGASFIALIHVVIYVIRTCIIYSLRPKKCTPTDSENDATMQNCNNCNLSLEASSAILRQLREQGQIITTLRHELECLKAESNENKLRRKQSH